ncbi:MAG: QueT transporter family protein [Eubacteriales bacterium]|nr:QueT transporter family protein [Eubacteriales bacterium]
MKKVFTVRFMAEAGIIAAVYFALTMAVAPISYGQLQMRVSEALCILPFFTPAAIPGLFIGCLLANIFSFLGIFDVVFGSLATLVAALITHYIRKKWLLPLPSVVVNAFAVGALLYYLAELPFWLSVLYVGAGQAIACYALGMPLFFLLNKHKDRLFIKR